MTITMQSFALTWTDADGVPRASAVSYDKRSAEHREAELKDAHATDIVILPIEPGELPEPRA
ncbi:hypothetical protein [Streptomyces griseorubiginosus]|uniref:hypothetical protein n=1 Tax=Streptomyces griseorubiginosus TaxID=67304 RepID=UPI00364EC21F